MTQDYLIFLWPAQPAADIQSTSAQGLAWPAILVTIFLVSSVFLIVIYRLQKKFNARIAEVLKKQKTVEEKVNTEQLNSSFLVNLSHELRTPLTLILAPLENELKKDKPAEEREGLLFMKRNAIRLLDSFNQFVDWLKIETGKMELKIRNDNLHGYLTELISSFEPLALQRNIFFHKQISVPESYFWFDQDKLTKILTNLVLYSIKRATEKGTLAVKAEINNQSLLSIRISGSGIIPDDAHENIFKPFFKTGSTQTEENGLSLFLVSELVKIYRGTIHVTQLSGKESTFEVILPIQKEAFSDEQIVLEDQQVNAYYNLQQSIEDNPTPAESANSEEDKDRILIVEDNQDMRMFISSTLQVENYSVITASDGQEAIPLAITHVPSLIVSDLVMPTLDGIEMTKIIKEDERTSHIPVILLTAKTDLNLKLDGLKTGADDYITKPFSSEELVVRIKNLIGQRKKLAQKFKETVEKETNVPEVLSLDDKFLKRVREIIETNISDYTFSVEQLAEEACISRTQLLRKVKALTGTSPNDLIKDMRLTKAAQMIKGKVDTITQIGYAVGFNDQSYFTKCFKKQFGVTPSEYAGK